MPGLIFSIRKIPNGTIKQWKDLIANIPLGWQICDGTNGTPDLRAKFTRAAPAGNNPGTTGGADTVTLDSTMIPSHNHSITDPTHTHGFAEITASTTLSGTGQQPGDVNTSSVAPTITINNAGGGGAHENRPTFYEVIYIMKVTDK